MKFSGIEYSGCISVNGKEVSVDIQTPYGQWYFNKENCSFADCYILCYDITKKRTLESIRNFWLPELAEIGCQDIETKFILVGTKLDLVNENNECREVSEEEAAALRDKYFGKVSLECSAKEKVNVDLVFKHAIKYALTDTYRDNLVCCSIL